MRRSIYGLTLVSAFCSIVYELLLAQTMGALLGNTFLRYNVTIGIYLAALGAGSLLCKREGPAASMLTLVRIEWLLALLGSAGPLLLFAWDAATFKAARALGLAAGGGFHLALVHAFDHSVVVAVGLLSGFELPLLMRLGGDDDSERVLAVDYFGTLAGAVAFPLLLLPATGLIGTAAVTGLLNAGCALFVLWKAAPRRRADWLGPVAAAVLAAALTLANRPIERAVSFALSAPVGR